MLIRFFTHQVHVDCGCPYARVRTYRTRMRFLDVPTGHTKRAFYKRRSTAEPLLPKSVRACRTHSVDAVDAVDAVDVVVVVYARDH